jgi:predicted HicB family RNase H-like nuclease
MRKIRFLLLFTGIIFGGIQFFRPVKNQSTIKDSQDDFSRVYATQSAVQTVLQAACYDCHSNHTHYPWYAEIQPAAWFLANHIKEGKEELNFNEYSTYSLKRQRNKLKRMKEQITAGKMPLRSYTLLHADARLTAVQQQLLTNWIDSTLRNNASPRRLH